MCDFSVTFRFCSFLANFSRIWFCISSRLVLPIINASAAFGAKSDTADFDKERDALHRKIGELEMDVDFCKRVYKQLGIPIPERH